MVSAEVSNIAIRKNNQLVTMVKETVPQLCWQHSKIQLLLGYFSGIIRTPCSLCMEFSTEFGNFAKLMRSSIFPSWNLVFYCREVPDFFLVFALLEAEGNFLFLCCFCQSIKVHYISSIFLCPAAHKKCRPESREKTLLVYQNHPVFPERTQQCIMKCTKY